MTGLAALCAAAVLCTTTFTPPPGVYNSTVMVTLSSPSGLIYYSVNNGPTQAYLGAVRLDAGEYYIQDANGAQVRYLVTEVLEGCQPSLVGGRYVGPPKFVDFSYGGGVVGVEIVVVANGVVSVTRKNPTKSYQMLSGAHEFECYVNGGAQNLVYLASNPVFTTIDVSQQLGYPLLRPTPGYHMAPLRVADYYQKLGTILEWSLDNTKTTHKTDEILLSSVGTYSVSLRLAPDGSQESLYYDPGNWMEVQYIVQDHAAKPVVSMMSGNLIQIETPKNPQADIFYSFEDVGNPVLLYKGSFTVFTPGTVTIHATCSEKPYFLESEPTTFTVYVPPPCPLCHHGDCVLSTTPAAPSYCACHVGWHGESCDLTQTPFTVHKIFASLEVAVRWYVPVPSSIEFFFVTAGGRLCANPRSGHYNETYNFWSGMMSEVRGGNGTVGAWNRGAGCYLDNGGVCLDIPTGGVGDCHDRVAMVPVTTLTDVIESWKTLQNKFEIDIHETIETLGRNIGSMSELSDALPTATPPEDVDLVLEILREKTLEGLPQLAGLFHDHNYHHAVPYVGEMLQIIDKITVGDDISIWIPCPGWVPCSGGGGVGDPGAAGEAFSRLWEWVVGDVEDMVKSLRTDELAKFLESFFLVGVVHLWVVVTSAATPPAPTSVDAAYMAYLLKSRSGWFEDNSLVAASVEKIFATIKKLGEVIPTSSPTFTCLKQRVVEFYSLKTFPTTPNPPNMGSRGCLDHLFDASHELQNLQDITQHDWGVSSNGVEYHFAGIDDVPMRTHPDLFRLNAAGQLRGVARDFTWGDSDTPMMMLAGHRVMSNDVNRDRVSPPDGDKLTQRNSAVIMSNPRVGSLLTSSCPDGYFNNTKTCVICDVPGENCINSVKHLCGAAPVGMGLYTSSTHCDWLCIVDGTIRGSGDGECVEAPFGVYPGGLSCEVLPPVSNPGHIEFTSYGVGERPYSCSAKGVYSGISSHDMFPLRCSYSVAGWVRLEGILQDGVVYLIYAVGVDNVLLGVDGAQQIVFRVNGVDFVSTKVSFTTSQWVHIAAIVQGTELTLYANSAVVYSWEGPGSILCDNNGGRGSIGGYFSQSNTIQPFPGDISSVVARKGEYNPTSVIPSKPYEKTLFDVSPSPCNTTQYSTLCKPCPIHTIYSVFPRKTLNDCVCKTGMMMVNGMCEGTTTPAPPTPCPYNEIVDGEVVAGSYVPVAGGDKVEVMTEVVGGKSCWCETSLTWCEETKNGVVFESVTPKDTMCTVFLAGQSRCPVRVTVRALLHGISIVKSVSPRNHTFTSFYDPHPMVVHSYTPHPWLFDPSQNRTNDNNTDEILNLWTPVLSTLTIEYSLSSSTPWTPYDPASPILMRNWMDFTLRATSPHAATSPTTSVRYTRFVHDHILPMNPAPDPIITTQIAPVEGEDSGEGGLVLTVVVCLVCVGFLVLPAVVWVVAARGVEKEEEKTAARTRQYALVAGGEEEEEEEEDGTIQLSNLTPTLSTASTTPNICQLCHAPTSTLYPLYRLSQTAIYVCADCVY